MSAKSKIALLGVSFLLIFNAICYAEAVETKYFTISFCSGCSVAEFAKKINAESTIRFETYTDSKSDIKSIIKTDVDALYLEVGDVLDMHLNSYHGRINVLPDNINVSEIAFGNAQIIENLLPSIYVPSQNTIHVSLKDLSVGMLSHEMAHALISNYFVVAPPPKVQEILAGYVEYSVRKRLGSLPRGR
ncbi:MAG: hypothetical protein WC412_06195 [Candidatus Omnitrophota bacterium]|jgi:hypothetical protein